MDSKFIVGIDLGTTNSALAQCDRTASEAARIEVGVIPQVVNPNEVADRTLLPSFLYIPGELDFPKNSLGLPWDEEPKFVIGELARKRGAENPGTAGCVGQIMAFLRRCEPHLTDPAVAGAGRGPQALAGGSLIAVSAVSADGMGRTAMRPTATSTLWQIRTFCSPCPHRLMKRPAS